MVYNRLETRIMTISKSLGVWRWLDCLNSAPLPNRIYVGFIAQTALYGNVNQISTYYENLNLASFNVKLNGRDLMVEPYKTRFVKDEQTGELVMNLSDGRSGYLGIVEILDLVRDPTAPMRLMYSTYMCGMTVFGLELGKCGEKSGTNGALDLEVRLPNDLTTYK